MKKIAKYLLIVLCLLILFILSICVYVFITIQSVKDPNIIDLKNLSLYNNQYEIFDSENQRISTNSKSGQKTIEINTLPAFVPQAFVSIEDKSFFQHNGLNLKRIIKAGFTNLMSGSFKEGASTITQQLIKNIYLNNEKTLTRKIQEAYLALQLENKYNKNEILETYLNVIYFGNGAFGIENASKTYFGKSACELTLPESATLAGIIKSPKTYSPISNFTQCAKRRNLVLKNMLDDEVISEIEYQRAIQTELKLCDNLGSRDDYINEILRETSDLLDMTERQVSCAGYKIYTSINSKLQSEIANLQSSTKENAMLVIDNNLGNILATFGNISARRQPASTIKPFLCYAPNFELGTLSPATPILDEQTNFNGYMPKNANGKYSGWVDTRTALSQSLNVPAVKALSYTDLNFAVNFAKKCGFELTNEDYNFATALGATNLGTPIKSVAQAYSALANLGTKKSINLILKITNSNGKVIYKAKKNHEKVMSEETAYMLVDILKDTVSDGTAKKLNVLNKSNLSSKTGTFGASDGTNTDAWCVSFSPQFTVLSWFGNSSGNHDKNLKKTENGGTICARQNVRVWEKLGNIYHDDADFVCPKNVTKLRLDSLSLNQQRLELASKNTPQRYTKLDLFNIKYAPSKQSSNFEIITAPILNLIKKQDNLILSWEGEEIYNYQIYAKTARSTNLIATQSGANKTLSYSLPAPNETTDYFLVISSKFTPTLTKNTNTQKFFVPV